MHMNYICLQVHRELWPRKYVEVRDAAVETATLTFPGTEYQNIEADVLIYTLIPTPSYTVLTKGLEDDCVFLCMKVGDLVSKVFQLKIHVCGIDI